MEDMDNKGISCSSKHMTGPHFISGPGHKIQVLLDMEEVDVFNDEGRQTVYNVLHPNHQKSDNYEQHQREELMPCLFEVPMQSEPVSPPPMTMTFLSVAKMSSLSKPSSETRLFC